MPNKCLKRLGAFLVGLNLIFLGFAGAQAAGPFVDSGTFRTTVYVNVATMDPAEAFVWYEMLHVRNCYEGLLNYDLRDFSIKPSLAESWKVDENGGTFNLRKGVKFHDGSEFDAAAVRFNWERIMAANKNPAHWLKDVKDIKIVDKYTVRIETTKNWAFLLDALAAQQVFLMASPAAVKKHATAEDPWAFKWFHNNTCGTGPYMLKEWIANQHINMVRFEDYWQGWEGKHFSGMLVRVVPERSAQLMMIQKGEVDFLNYLPQEFWPGLKADPNIEVLVFPSRAEQTITLNNAKEPLSNKDFRLAIAYALDYDACHKTLGAVKGGMIVSSIDKQDLAKAKEHLVKSGYAGKEVVLDIPYSTTSPNMERLAIILEDNLKKLGVTPKLRGTTWQAIAKELFGDPKQGPSLLSLFSTSIFWEPYGWLFKMYHSSNNVGGYNLGYSNPEFDALLDKAAITIDKNKRNEIYEEAKKILINDAPSAWVCMIPYVAIYRKNIKVHSYTRIGDMLGNLVFPYDMYKE